MIVEIAPEKRTGIDKDTFSYLVPENLIENIKVGSICTIPFGKKEFQGVVFEIHEKGYKIKEDFELKSIKSIVQDITIPEQYLRIAKWISEYYLCSIGEAVSLFLPPKISHPRISKVSSSKYKVESRVSITLTPEQEQIYQKLKGLLSTDHKQSTINKQALLFGVTGSGKTEIYLKLTEENLKAKKQTIVLVPEIMLTPQIVEIFEKTFPNETCLMHSGLSQSEKYISYKDFYSGKKNILIGPRSALLVPSTNLGLVIIDEEQEDAYKQEKSPRYHAVDLAFEICKSNSSLLLLGTATPRIETFWRAKNGELNLFEMKSRFQKESLPSSKIIDLKYEIKQDNLSPVSVELQRMIQETLDNKKQILLFLNRRGMSTFVSCRECGEIINCPKCAIPLVYHINQGTEILNCHHCDYKTIPPRVCPECGSSKIKFFGAGVDKIESEIRRLFPTARIRKVDSKSLQNKGEYSKLYKELRGHEIDILIGTQILAKGLDIPNVDLVGVISADTGLHMPHFRASEKTFQILTQVSGRSGRKESIGHTIIQTYWPESSAIQFASQHDFNGFYKGELFEREAINYPPFCHIIRLVSGDKSKAKAKKILMDIVPSLTENEIEFIGPGPCFLSRINDIYRFHILIKIKEIPNDAITQIFKEHPFLTWDIDPVDLL